MNHTEATQYIKSTLAAFGPGEAISFTQDTWAKIYEAMSVLIEQPAQQEQGDSICQENDGCPTEKAVLQRFWRGQSIPDEHYPAWFKPAQQEPVGHLLMGPKQDFVTTSAAGELEINVWHPVYTSPPAQRTWQGLTDKETEHLWEISRAAMPRYHTFKTLIEKALRECNT